MSSMQLYADIIKNHWKKGKIEIFCECVEVLNLNGEDIKKFAEMCGFTNVNVYRQSRGRTKS